MLKSRYLSVLMLMLSWSWLTFAQGGATGAISGPVQDASGGVVAGAKIKITSEATGQLMRQLSFANPSATDIESASSFSQITSVVGTPRLIQFSLKYLF